MKRKIKKNPSFNWRGYLTALLTIFAFAAALSLYMGWRMFLRPNVETDGEEFVHFEIPSGSSFEDLMELLEEEEVLRDVKSFRWAAERKNLPAHIHPGRYRLEKGMGNNAIVNMLRSASRETVRVVFNQTRTLEQLASVISGQIEADSASLAEKFNDKELISELGHTPETFPAIFVPNTYEFYWNTTAEQFIRRMNREFDGFWNEQREKLREETGLSRVEVVTLASIVAEETFRVDEMPAIAGVYINRLDRGMRLQADPTIKYIIEDFSIGRVLTVHLKKDSPYNTYMYGGLPPGPIIIPSLKAIEAVLEYEEHDYLYFSAREDFSGYHRFARTLAEHNRNARLYREALDERGIFR